ncbi:MerR family transcriptional regulator [Streptomyces sp. NBC_00091]|uniref:helix-turn-helix domain-containing protein n=1 Tax=Streptomyces sp. NBC_00091 TaxID=2975648 RepID=UPI0022528709|nr:MerR family transcriptional regulator [Streptomyces sp. NBC_00091]MCX5378956.1 MerR family transcriptional regulator [Streptomyces sp. NBC_00091]
MDGATELYSIGELARRTGLAVRTIRFYSDEGVVVPSCRSRAGYRLYDLDALVRLELVRTLRELGVDLPTVRRVLDRELSVAEVAAVHADAVEVQIRALRLRRAVLRLVAGRGSGPEEVLLMHRVTRLSVEEGRRLVEVLVEGADPEVAGMVRAATPELSEDPSVEQLAAWVELAELVGDEGFRVAFRGAPGVEGPVDARVERYWRLVWVVNGWEVVPGYER